MDVTDMAAIDNASSLELDQNERDSLVSIVERSLEVRDRSQFFLWTQGIVQRLVPHEILICGAMDDAASGLVMHQFAVTRYFRQEHFDAVCEPHSGIVTRATAWWRSAGTPCLLAPGLYAQDGVDHTEALVKYELKNLAVHGVRSSNGGILGLFCFARIAAELNPHFSYLLELLVPTLHSALMRVLIQESQPTTFKPVKMPSITGRETEVLRWIKRGKSNAEIAKILNLSPWTIKNHMQGILKKLAVQNRSHAVARAISLGILNSTE